MTAGRISTVLEMIKFEHSVFALPFALTGALLAARATRHGWPTLRQVLWIVVAMVAARSAAMTMNRIADLRYDRENPRTQQRALATGALSVSFAWIFTLVAVAAFLIAAWQLNPLALKLAPLALAVLFFYSFTKRFTNWSHLFLGFALGISPAAAWIAITDASIASGCMRFLPGSQGKGLYSHDELIEKGNLAEAIRRFGPIFLRNPIGDVGIGCAAFQQRRKLPAIGRACALFACAL